MSHMSAHRLLGVVGVAAVLGACSTGISPEDEPTGTPSQDQSVLVDSGVRYAGAPTGWSDPLLDLFLPADAGESPVALIVPDAGADPRSADYLRLARDLAARGVIAAVAHWGVESPQLTAVAGRTVEDLVAQAHQVTAEVACAARVAASRIGPRVGTPDRPLVLVGHGSGANAAAMAALTRAPPFDTCFVGGDAPRVAAAILWDGDWFGAVADDALGAGAATFLATYSPWPSVDSLGTQTFVEVGVNANRLVGLAVAAVPTTSYVTTRDPSGSMTDDLVRVKAFDNATLDPVDVTRAFEVGLRDGGVQSREREVHGEGDPDTLGPRVRALIVQSVVQLTRPT